MTILLFLSLTLPLLGTSLPTNNDDSAKTPSRLGVLRDLKLVLNSLKPDTDDVPYFGNDAAGFPLGQPEVIPNEAAYDVTDIDDVTDGEFIVLPVTKRAEPNYHVSKRIHTCAFMSRFGHPIGLCFAGNSGARRASRRPVSKPRPAARVAPKPNAYAILEKHWPVHSMLGGGVGRR